MKALLAALGILGVLALGSGSAGAEANKLHGITVTPFSQSIKINAGTPITNINFSVTNNTSIKQTLYLSVIDFGTLDDTGGLLFNGATNKLISKYGLATWFSLDKQQVTLQPQEKTGVAGRIRNDTSIRPGGHYGALLINTQPSQDTTGNAIALKQTVTSLVLATKTGGEHYDMRLNNVKLNGNFLNFPTKAVLSFHNAGNVHLTPRGLVKLTGKNNTVISQGAINEDSNIILPELSRNIYAYLHKSKPTSWLPFSRYNLTIDYRYDGIDGFVNKSFTIWRANLTSIAALAIIIAVITYVVIRRFR